MNAGTRLTGYLQGRGQEIPYYGHPLFKLALAGLTFRGGGVLRGAGRIFGKRRERSPARGRVVGRRVVEIRPDRIGNRSRSEEHTSELQSLMRISYAVFCMITKKHNEIHT